MHKHINELAHCKPGPSPCGQRSCLKSPIFVKFEAPSIPSALLFICVTRILLWYDCKAVSSYFFTAVSSPCRCTMVVRVKDVVIDRHGDLKLVLGGSIGYRRVRGGQGSMKFEYLGFTIVE